MADTNFFIYETGADPFTEKFAPGISTNPTVPSGSMYIKNEGDTSINVLYYGTITVSALGAPVKTEIPTSITITEVATPNQTTVTWTPNGFQSYGDTDGNGNEYLSWRTDNSGSQYLTSGYSFDVWSPSLYVDIIGNNRTWAGLESQTPYTLNTNKHTLNYYYDGPTAVHWSKGGKIGFTNINQN